MAMRWRLAVCRGGRRASSSSAGDGGAGVSALVTRRRRVADTPTQEAAPAKVPLPAVVPPRHAHRRSMADPVNVHRRKADEMRLPSDESGYSARLREFTDIAQFVRKLESAREKIEFISPYERNWQHAEKRWHRPWFPPLMKPRGAYFVPIVPAGYNSLDFYKFITKTVEADKLELSEDFLLGGDDLDAVAFGQFEESFRELLEDELVRARQPSTDESTVRTFSLKKRSAEHATISPYAELRPVVLNADQLRVNKLLQYFVDCAQQHFSSVTPHLGDGLVSLDSRLDAFWTRRGFESLYRRRDGQMALKDELRVDALREPAPGDTRSRDGDLAFRLGAKPAVQLRQRAPLAAVAPRQHCSSERAKPASVAYSPVFFNLWTDTAPLMMAPGVEPESGDPCLFTHTLVSEVADIGSRCANWRVDAADAAETVDCARAALVAAGFASTVAQAHLLGFTPFTDVTYPLFTQLILSDGADWYFGAFQLNTLDLGFPYPKPYDNRAEFTNAYWFDGPHRLYDSIAEDGRAVGWNADCVKRALRLLLRAPHVQEGVDLTPYLTDYDRSRATNFDAANLWWPEDRKRSDVWPR